MENPIARLLSPKEHLALQSCIGGDYVDTCLQQLGWSDTYSTNNPSEEGFINLTGELPPLYIERVPIIGGRKLFNKRSQKIRKELQKEYPAGVTVCTPFIMQRCSLFGAWLLSEGFLQYHGTIRIEGEKIPLHFWCRKGQIILPKVKLKSMSQYQACIDAGLI